MNIPDIGSADFGIDGGANTLCEGRVINTDEELAIFTDCEEIIGDLVLIETSISTYPLSSVRRITGRFITRQRDAQRSSPRT